MKKFSCIVLAAVMAAGVSSMAACGGNQDDSSSSNVLSITISDSSSEILIQKKLSKAFQDKMKAEQNMDIEVKYTTFSTGKYTENIMTLFTTRSLGDVIYAYDDTAGLLLNNGVIEALDEIMAADTAFDVNVYNQDIMNTAKSNGAQMYMPRSFDQITTFINYDIFEELGMTDKVPMPITDSSDPKYVEGDPWAWWTWDECLALCAELRTKMDEYYGYSAEYMNPIDANLAWDAVYDPIVKSFGGNIVDAETLTSGLNSTSSAYAATLKAFEWMKSALIDTEYTPAGAGTFAAGNQAMAFHTRPSIASPNSRGIEMRFAPIPRFTKTQTGIEDGETYVGFGSSGYAINKSSTKKDLAWEFIKFTMSSEGQAIISADGLSVPIIQSERTVNSGWTGLLGDVDQSAFLYEGNSYSFAKYARGISLETESSIYSKMNQSFFTQIKKEPVACCAGLYGVIADFIKR